MLGGFLLSIPSKQPTLYFWRDHNGREIDCIVDGSRYPAAIEIKAGKTVVTDFFKEIVLWQETTDTPQAPRYIIYGGSENQSWPQAKVLSWKFAGDLIKKLE